MNKVALVGIDLGKHSFHLHGQDGAGRAVFRKKLSRLQMMRLFGNLPACTVVMEACAGAHFTARELNKLGHVAKLISPQFVRPFVKSNKNDFVDAEAICEAACRPSMRFVAPKTADSTPSGHPVHDYPAGHSTHIRPSVPRPSGRAVGAQRRRFCIVSLRRPAPSISSSACASIRP